MPFAKCKVYSDGSHFIAIPHTEKPYKPRHKPREDKIVVADEQTETEQDMSEEEEASVSVIKEPSEKGIENDGSELSRNGEKKRIMTKRSCLKNCMLLIIICRRIRERRLSFRRCAPILMRRKKRNIMSLQIWTGREETLYVAVSV